MPSNGSDAPRFAVLQTLDGGRSWGVIYLCDSQDTAEEVMREWKNPAHPDARLAVCSLTRVGERTLALPGEQAPSIDEQPRWKGSAGAEERL